jgi:hypothetical protein
VQQPRGFSAEIERLQLENEVLFGRLQELSDALETEVGQKLHVEREKEQLRERLEAAERNVKEHADEARRYQTALSKCFGELDKALPVLADLRHAVLDGPAL